MTQWQGTRTAVDHISDNKKPNKKDRNYLSRFKIFLVYLVTEYSFFGLSILRNMFNHQTPLRPATNPTTSFAIYFNLFVLLLLYSKNTIFCWSSPIDNGSPKDSQRRICRYEKKVPCSPSKHKGKSMVWLWQQSTLLNGFQLAFGYLHSTFENDFEAYLYNYA